jgi:hypothetical protein
MLLADEESRVNITGPPSHHHDALLRNKRLRRDAIRHYLGYQDAVKTRERVAAKQTKERSESAETETSVMVRS